jgi:hypothetical protein
MNHLIDGWLTPALLGLADWSMRWGLIIGLLAVTLALVPLRRPATRHLLCLAQRSKIDPTSARTRRWAR